MWIVKVENCIKKYSAIFSSLIYIKYYFQIHLFDDIVSGKQKFK